MLHARLIPPKIDNGDLSATMSVIRRGQWLMGFTDYSSYVITSSKWMGRKYNIKDCQEHYRMECV